MHSRAAARRGAGRTMPRQMLERLQAADADADLGAPGRLAPAAARPRERRRCGEVARIFGDDFAGALLKAEPGRWAARSARATACTWSSSTAREGGSCRRWPTCGRWCERDFMAERRKRALDAMYARLLERYPVVIERRSRRPRRPAAARRRAMRRGRARGVCSPGCCCGWPPRGGAHELRPGVLELRESAARQLCAAVEAARRRRGRDPHRAGAARRVPRRDARRDAADAGCAGRARHDRLRRRPARPHHRRSTGLESTITDVLVRVEHADGWHRDAPAASR